MMRMGLEYDVVVIGCGPSGASSLRRCAELGLKAVGIEKRKPPSAKPCAGVLYPRVLEDFHIPGMAIVSDLERVRLVAPSGRWVDIDLDPCGAIVDRGILDSLLMKEAVRAGADILEGRRVRGIESGDKRCRVVVEEFGGLRASFIIAADGVYSTVARALGLSWGKDDLALALQRYIRPTREREEMRGAFEAHYDPIRIPGGWFWLVDRGGELLAGAGIILKHAKDPRRIKEALTNFISERLGDVETIREEAYMLPIGGPRSPDALVVGRVILVGDAGGFVRSDTGEGIYYAMHSGLAAAEALSEYLRGGTSLKKMYLKRLEEHNLLQLYGSRELHETFLNVEGAEAFVERLGRLR